MAGDWGWWTEEVGIGSSSFLFRKTHLIDSLASNLLVKPFWIGSFVTRLVSQLIGFKLLARDAHPKTCRAIYHDDSQRQFHINLCIQYSFSQPAPGSPTPMPVVFGVVYVNITASGYQSTDGKRSAPSFPWIGPYRAAQAQCASCHRWI